MKFAISAGELSGDEHAASLVRALRALESSVEIRGMGGRHLRAAGVDTVVDYEGTGSAMGFQELLPKLRGILGAMSRMKQFLKQWRPEVLIIVDYPDFNLRLARYAKSLGIKVFYYITPKVWAWRPGRVKVINEVVDQAAVIFPFERPFFEKHGFSRSVYVGHPFCTTLQRCCDPQEELRFRSEVLSSWGLKSNQPVLAVFPGSRKNEVLAHMKHLLGAMEILVAKFPQVQVVLSIAPSVESAVREKLATVTLPIYAVSGRALDILRVADAGLLKSGTSNLQAAFYGLPFTMFFNIALGTELILRQLIHTGIYSLVNIVRRNSIAELIHNHVNSQNLAKEAEQLLFDSIRRRQIQECLGKVVEDLSSFDAHPQFAGTHSAPERAAIMAISL